MGQGRCHYCLRTWAMTERGKTRDHIVPGYFGAKQMPKQNIINIVYACGECNGAKAAGVLPDHCTVCRDAHDAYLTWLARLVTVNPDRSAALRAMYERAPVLTLAQVIGVPRLRVLEASEDELLLDR